MADDDKSRLEKVNRTIRVPPSGPVATTSYSTSYSISIGDEWPPKPIDGLKILGYEIQMFLGLVPLALDENRFVHTDERVVKYAIVESACLHGRNVYRILLDKGDNREWKLRELISEYKLTYEQRRQLEDELAKLSGAWGQGDNTKSACHAFNMMIVHPSKHRGAYGVYDKFLKELATIIGNLRKIVEAVAGEFEKIE